MNREQDLLIGRQLGAYQVQGTLGEGGMARVYKAYHPRLRREVAIKVIHAQVADRKDFQARFEREAQVIASLEHANIVSIYDFGEEGDLTYLVMQYIAGGTLREQLHNRQPLDFHRAVHYTIQMARALHHAHQHGVIHRDVKPQNMLLSGTDPTHLLLSDFGIAKLYYHNEIAGALPEMLTQSATHNSSLTSVDQIIGTADYMAPEQVNAQPVDARTDVYALGIVLFQMLTGEVPFHSTTLQGLLFQQVYTPPPAVREKNLYVPEVLAQITARAIAKAPADRFPSAEALALALEQARSNATNSSTLGSSPTRFTPLANTIASNPSTFNTHQDNYATSDNERTVAGRSALTPPSSYGVSSGISSPTTNPALKGGNVAVRQRRLPLSYILIAAVLLVGLVIVGSRLLASGGTPSTSGNAGPATAFTEQFQDNSRTWPIGALNQGIEASTPDHGTYTVSVPYNVTAFPYPQKVGSLPDTFTLSATLKEVSGAASILYGLTFHLSENNGHLTTYALIMNNSGTYQVVEYTSAGTSPQLINQGHYSTSGQQTHTLQVSARGSTYTFTIDGKTVDATNGYTSWSNNDLNGGSPGLLLSGPNSASDPATSYQVSLVKLSLA